MAIDLYLENSTPLSIMSPRISFSLDISPSADINFPVEQSLLGSISSPEFDFCNNNSSNQHYVSAEDIFLDGKLLPTHQQKSTEKHEKSPTPPPQPQQPPPPPVKNHSKNYTTTCFDHQTEEQKKKSKSFWQFKRSSSLNSGTNSNSYARSLCPIPLLSRSNSAGSATNSKRISKDQGHNHSRQNSNKTPLVSSTKQSHLSSSSNNYQKPPLKKNVHGGNNSYGSLHGNGVRINVASANLFGLGSIFSSNSKVEKNKK